MKALHAAFVVLLLLLLSPFAVAKSALQAYQEAIMVCTFPAGPNGKFTCSNPVNKSGGHLKDISGYRTPEEMVTRATSSCPDQRKLTSSTHLVWGCGFAATGNSNSLDRSDGVDVQGRHTYYCYPKQTSCRKQTP